MILLERRIIAVILSVGLVSTVGSARGQSSSAESQAEQVEPAKPDLATADQAQPDQASGQIPDQPLRIKLRADQVRRISRFGSPPIRIRLSRISLLGSGHVGSGSPRSLLRIRLLRIRPSPRNLLRIRLLRIRPSPRNRLRIRPLRIRPSPTGSQRRINRRQSRWWPPHLLPRRNNNFRKRQPGCCSWCRS